MKLFTAASALVLMTLIPALASAQGGGMSGMAGMDMPGHIMIPAGALYTKADVEFMQFHPTTFYNPGHPTYLISEALRGYGGVDMRI